MSDADDVHLFCLRCGAELIPGRGDFWIVRILAVADPTPPEIADDDLQADLDSQIQKLLEEMNDMSERELTEQVFRRLTLHLCGRCYAAWIENPVG